MSIYLLTWVARRRTKNQFCCEEGRVEWRLSWEQQTLVTSPVVSPTRITPKLPALERSLTLEKVSSPSSLLPPCDGCCDQSRTRQLPVSLGRWDNNFSVTYRRSGYSYMCCNQDTHHRHWTSVTGKRNLSVILSQVLLHLTFLISPGHWHWKATNRYFYFTFDMCEEYDGCYHGRPGHQLSHLCDCCDVGGSVMSGHMVCVVCDGVDLVLSPPACQGTAMRHTPESWELLSLTWHQHTPSACPVYPHTVTRCVGA